MENQQRSNTWNRSQRGVHTKGIIFRNWIYETYCIFFMLEWIMKFSLKYLYNVLWIPFCWFQNGFPWLIQNNRISLSIKLQIKKTFNMKCLYNIRVLLISSLYQSTLYSVLSVWIHTYTNTNDWNLLITNFDQIF